MQEITQLLQEIHLGTTQTVHNLTMTPLLRDAAASMLVRSVSGVTSLSTKHWLRELPR